MLLTMEEAYKKDQLEMPNPERIDKVSLIVNTRLFSHEECYFTFLVRALSRKDTCM